MSILIDKADNVNTAICKLVCKQKMIPRILQILRKICLTSHGKILVLMNCLGAVPFPWHSSPSQSVAMFPPGVRIASQLTERGTNRNNDVNIS